MSKRPLKPTLDRRFTLLTLLLIALSAGLFLGWLAPAFAFIFAILVFITAAIVFFLTWHAWREEYTEWAKRPVRVRKAVVK